MQITAYVYHILCISNTVVLICICSSSLVSDKDVCVSIFVGIYQLREFQPFDVILIT